MTIALIPRSSRAIADQVNRYFRVLRGVDPDSLAVRLPTSGTFRVNHSSLGTPVLLVTDAGLDGAYIKYGSIQSASIATGAPIAPNSITSAEIANGEILPIDLAALPQASVTKAGVQSIPDNTTTQLAWDVEAWDNNGFHDNVTLNSRLICRTAGLYSVNAYVWWAIGGTGFRFTQIRLNGTAITSARTPAVSGNYTEQIVAAQVQAQANDYLEVYAHHTFGAPLDVLAASKFATVRLSALP